MKTVFRRIVLNLVSRVNRRGQLVGLFALTVIIGVELLVLTSFYIPKLNNKTRNYSLHHDQFTYGKDNLNLDGNDSNKNGTGGNSWIYSSKSRNINDDLFASASNASHIKDSILLPMIRSSCSQFNFSFAAPIVEPRFSDLENNIFLLVLIVSGVGRTSFLDQRNAIRGTWLMNARNMNSLKWKHVFLLGTSNDPAIDLEVQREAHFNNDILVLTSTDNYLNLIIKVLSGFRWAYMQIKPRFILKADDDVYIRIPHLITWLSKSENGKFFYGGYVYEDGAKVRRRSSTELGNTLSLDCYPEERFPAYSAGPFYVISSMAIPALFQGMRRRKVFPVEDAYMGLLASTSKIKPVTIPGFQLDDNVTYHKNCLWASKIAFGHHFDSAHLYYLRTKLLEVEELQLSQNFSICMSHQLVMTLCKVLLYLTLLLSVIVAVLFFAIMFLPYFTKSWWKLVLISNTINVIGHLLAQLALSCNKIVTHCKLRNNNPKTQIPGIQIVRYLSAN